MELQTLLAFTFVAVVVEISPGPNFFLLVRTVPSAGLMAGFGNIGGFASAFLLHGAFAAFGLSAAVTARPIALDAVKLVGGAYLMGIGTQTLFDLYGSRRSSRAAVRVPPAPVAPLGAASVPRSIGDGFVTNLFNPKIALFYLAAFPAFVGATTVPLEAFSLVLVHVAVAIVWFSLVALSCARLVAAFSSPAVSRGLTLLSGLVLVALGAGVVTS